MKKIELKPWSSIGWEEDEAAHRVIRKGCLSGFLGGELKGGPEVQGLEQEWAATFGVKQSVSVNSATSGLMIALKAVGVGPGDKVIVSPFSMSAGVAAIMWCGATPVFCDIGEDYLLDLTAIDLPRMEHKQMETVVLTTSLFGKVDRKSVEHTKGYIINDAAQAAFADEVWWHSDITVWSLNVHKMIQSGEGGICTTRSEIFDLSMRLMRNHGEMSPSSRLPGLNLRMTEITAAIAREQLKKGKSIVEWRRALVRQLIEGIKDIPGLRVHPFDPGHSYYIFPVRVDVDRRKDIVRGLNERGVPVRAGYVDPIYNLPAFAPYKRDCPVVERVAKEIITLEMYAWDFNSDIIEQIAEAFREVMR